MICSQVLFHCRTSGQKYFHLLLPAACNFPKSTHTWQNYPLNWEESTYLATPIRFDAAVLAAKCAKPSALFGAYGECVALRVFGWLIIVNLLGKKSFDILTPAKGAPPGGVAKTVLAASMQHLKGRNTLAEKTSKAGVTTVSYILYGNGFKRCRTSPSHALSLITGASSYHYDSILVKEQKGFRKGKTINMAIYDMLYKVHNRMDKRLPMYALFMDLTKAFDYVSHKMLLKKLELYGVRGNVNDLIKSYLSGRSQMTQINIKTKTDTIYSSDLKPVQQGVPQGSVLGPLLFIIYINDIVYSTQHDMILFADDCTVLYDKKSDINNSICNIIDWLAHNNLQINLNKTKIINFKQRLRKGEITSDVKYNGETDNICNRLSQASYALYKLSKIVNRETVLIAYHSLVGSVLRYGIIFWGNATGAKTVFTSQKRCLRSICNLRRTDSCKQHFIDLKILTVPSLYIYEVSIYVYTNPNLFRRFERTRRCDVYRAHPCKTALFHKSVFAMAPQIYNCLPKTLRDIDNLAERFVYAENIEIWQTKPSVSS
ncbi:reverse transcriptase (RNA-dependent DNA polymerase) domain-containing protein [Phthorimaea operculella]|nr:reverse transcriptase (RNA-dependent DNA polymerase) domain-containing protein [Phthorimaea operculella]